MSESLDDTARSLSVSRETAQGILAYRDAVLRWTKTVNLIGKTTLPKIWERHIRDSAQIMGLVPQPPQHWLDLGSGGGFPGVVCALLAKDKSWTTRFTLVESDKRKAAFLATISRQLDLAIDVQATRIESLPLQGADLVTARALAPLPTIFSLATPHCASNAILLLPKGARFEDEILAARQDWSFTLNMHPSITSPEARILECADVTHRREGSQR